MDAILEVLKQFLNWLGERSPIQIIPETEEGVRWRLGRMHSSKSGGVIFIMPFVETVDRIDITTGAMLFTPQLLTTKDAQSAAIQLGVTYHVADGKKMLLHLGANDTEAVVSVIGQGIAINEVRTRTLEEVIRSQSYIEIIIRDLISERVEQYGLECDTAHLTQCGRARGLRLLGSK